MSESGWPSKEEGDARRLIDHFSFGAAWARVTPGLPLPISAKTVPDAAAAMRAGEAWEKAHLVDMEQAARAWVAEKAHLVDMEQAARAWVAARDLAGTRLVCAVPDCDFTQHPSVGDPVCWDHKRPCGAMRGCALLHRHQGPCIPWSS